MGVDVLEEDDLGVDVLKLGVMALPLYTMVCPPVQADNAQALVCGLFAVKADKPWYN